MAYLNVCHFKDLSFLPKPMKTKKVGSGIIPEIVPYSGAANAVLKNIPVGSIINTAIDHLPFQAHVPGYRYLGPGTRLDENLKNNVKPINKLDAAALDHDKAYASTKDGKERAKAVSYTHLTLPTIYSV